MREEFAATVEASAELHSGQQVYAGQNPIGELVGILVRDGERYLHVRRFGPGLDELYIPSVAIAQAVGDHITLHLNALDLLGQAWHERPETAREVGSANRRAKS
jgi:hypothetical protein